MPSKSNKRTNKKMPSKSKKTNKKTRTKKNVAKNNKQPKIIIRYIRQRQIQPQYTQQPQQLQYMQQPPPPQQPGVFNNMANAAAIGFGADLGIHAGEDLYQAI